MIGVVHDILELCRLTIAVVFLFSTIGKARDIRGFVVSISDLVKIPHGASIYAAICIIVVEGVTTLLLLSGGDWSRKGMVIASGLLLAFTGLTASVVLTRRQVYCSCFGSRQRPLSCFDVMRNAVMIVMSFLSIAFGTQGAPITEPSNILLTAAALVVFQILNNMHVIVEYLFQAEAHAE